MDIRNIINISIIPLLIILCFYFKTHFEIEYLDISSEECNCKDEINNMKNESDINGLKTKINDLRIDLKNDIDKNKDKIEKHSLKLEELVDNFKKIQKVVDEYT